jgi:hypothetical protein
VLLVERQRVIAGATRGQGQGCVESRRSDEGKPRGSKYSEMKGPVL